MSTEEGRRLASRASARADAQAGGETDPEQARPVEATRQRPPSRLGRRERPANAQADAQARGDRRDTASHPHNSPAQSKQGQWGQRDSATRKGSVLWGDHSREVKVEDTHSAREPSCHRGIDHSRVGRIDVACPIAIVEACINEERLVPAPAKSTLDGGPINIGREQSTRQPDAKGMHRVILELRRRYPRTEEKHALEGFVSLSTSELLLPGEGPKSGVTRQRAGGTDAASSSSASARQALRGACGSKGRKDGVAAKKTPNWSFFARPYLRYTPSPRPGCMPANRAGVGNAHSTPPTSQTNEANVRRPSSKGVEADGLAIASLRLPSSANVDTHAHVAIQKYWLQSHVSPR